jgi:hypothetical protein
MIVLIASMMHGKQIKATPTPMNWKYPSIRKKSMKLANALESDFSMQSF